MKKLRKSLFTRATCVLLSITLLAIGCIPEPAGLTTVTNKGNCSSVKINTLNNVDVADSFENVMELARSIHYQEDYNSYSEFHIDLFGETEETNAQVEIFESESARYQSLGMEAYLSSKPEISDKLTQYFNSYSSLLMRYLLEENPNLEVLKSFFDNQNSLVLKSELCDTDKNLMSFYLNASKGYAQYYYKHYYDATDGSAELRGCNFWESIGCRLLALFVGAVVSTVTSFIALVGGSLTVNGLPASQGFIKLAALALRIYVGLNVYDWCCGNDEIADQLCLAPSNSLIRFTPCGEIKYRIWGASTYGPTEWTNLNTTPSVITTDFPVLVLTVPDIGTPSIMDANVSCLNNAASVSIFEWEEEVLFEEDQIQGPVNLEWVITPPSNTNLGIPFSMQVDILGDFDPDKHELKWSITKPNLNSLQSLLYYADAVINTSSGALITVSLFDQCLERNVASLSHFVEGNG